MSEQMFPGRIWITNPDTDFLRMQNLGPQHEWLHLTEHKHILAEKDKRIEKLREALAFYSRHGGVSDTHDRKGCWILARRFCFTEAIAHDIEKLPFGETGTDYYIAGKRARAALQEDGK